MNSNGNEHSSSFNKFMRGMNQIKPTARGMWTEEELSTALEEVRQLCDTLTHEYKMRKIVSQRHLD